MFSRRATSVEQRLVVGDATGRSLGSALKLGWCANTSTGSGVAAGELVEPVTLRRAAARRRRARARRCRAPRAPPRRAAPRTARPGAPARVAHGVVVAAHVVHPLAEPPVAGEERLVLLGASGVGEVALDHDRHRGRARASRRRPRRSSARGTASRRAHCAAPGRWRRSPGSPVLPHSVSPKCTSLAVASVARSRPAGRASVRTRAGQPPVGRRALDDERRTRCRARAR